MVLFIPLFIVRQLANNSFGITNRTFGHEVHPKVDKFLKEYNSIEGDKVSHGLGTYVLITLLALLALFAKKLRMRATGWHKKVERPNMRFSSFDKKYRDS